MTGLVETFDSKGQEIRAIKDNGLFKEVISSGKTVLSKYFFFFLKTFAFSLKNNIP